MRTIVTGIGMTVILLFSCKKDKPEKDLITVPCDHRTNKLEEVRHLIAGKYEWAYTREITRLQPIRIHTPSSTGMTHQYVFDREGNVMYYENNQLIWDRNYEVDYEMRATLFDQDSAAAIIMTDKTTNRYITYLLVRLCNDSSLFYKPSSIENFRYYKRERL